MFLTLSPQLFHALLRGVPRGLRSSRVNNPTSHSPSCLRGSSRFVGSVTLCWTCASMAVCFGLVWRVLVAGEGLQGWLP